MLNFRSRVCAVSINRLVILSRFRHAKLSQLSQLDLTCGSSRVQIFFSHSLTTIRELRSSSHLDGSGASSRDNKRLPPKPTAPLCPNHLGPSLPANRGVSAKQPKKLFGIVEERHTHQRNERELRPVAGYGEWVVKDAVEE